jgi:hypothetical protein
MYKNRKFQCFVNNNLFNYRIYTIIFTPFGAQFNYLYHLLIKFENIVTFLLFKSGIKVDGEKTLVQNEYLP